MTKILFLPISLAGGLLGGALGKKTFERLWALFDDQDAPDPKRQQVNLGKLTAALVLEGAIFRAVRGLIDHGSRRAFTRLTGAWPGEEERPQS
jgi:hypothetical protein